MSSLLQNSEFFGAALTIIAFEAGLALRRRFNNPLVNPFLISVIIIIGALYILGLDYESYSLSAQHISFLVTPATVCLAIPLYRQLRVLRENLAAVLAGVCAGVLINAAVIFAAATIARLGHVEYVSLLPKSITTPIGMALSAEYGGIEAMTILAILVTGISGNVMGEWLLEHGLDESRLIVENRAPSTVGNAARNRDQYPRTASTRVCCSMTSLIQTG